MERVFYSALYLRFDRIQDAIFGKAADLLGNMC